MYKVSLAAAIGVSALVLSGCASVTRGTTDTVMVYASPEGAQIATSIGLSCNTSPCSLQVSRKTEFAVIVSKEGYESQTVHVGTGVGPGGAAGMAGNVLIGGVIGVGIDTMSGATLDHIPNPVLVELIPKDPNNPKTPKGDLSDVRQQLAEKRRKQQEATAGS